MDKKGFIGMYSDVIKGFVAGLVITLIAVAVILMLKLVPAINSMLCGCKT